MYISATKLSQSPEMEKIMVAKSRLQEEGDTVFCATRYGNVMASRGSVIPLFVSQLKDGKPLTVTDPNMTRFLMSLEESVDLVMNAFKYGKSGDIFAQKAPATNIFILAKAVQKIFKVRENIKIIGTRHGEKLYETLVSREELSRALEKKTYYRIINDNRDLNYNKFFSKGVKLMKESNDYNSHNTNQLGLKDVINVLNRSGVIG